MIIKFYKKVIHLLRYFKLLFIINDISHKVTFIGKGQKFGCQSRVCLFEGATKKNIILQDNAEVLGTLCATKNGLIIFGEWAKIGPGSIIEATNKIEIGRDAAISTHVIIRDNNSHPISPTYRRKMRHTPHGSIERSSSRAVSAPIIIGENVWIGEHVRICKGVTIGDNAIIAAFSVVTKNVPANAIAAGNPAKIVKENIDLLPEPQFS